MSKTLSRLALFCILISRADAAQLLINGGFETGDFTGWSQSGWFIDTTDPEEGIYDASTGCGGPSCTTVGDPNSAYLDQIVTTTPGITYNLSFFYNSGQDPTQGSELLVLWGDPNAPSLSTVVDFMNVDTLGSYEQYTGTVTATSVMSELEFLGRQDFDFYYVDNVSLTSPVSTVPEPGSGILIAVGLIGYVLVRRATGPARPHFVIKG